MNSNTAIFVTGGTGFIGSYILRMLLKSGFKNLTATRRASSRFDLLGEAKERIKWVECDILDIVTLHQVLQSEEVVIHAAALVSFDPKDQFQLQQVNVEGTANIVNTCISTDISKLVHISSIGVFPRKKPGETIDESVEWSDSVLNTDYAISKYRAELEVWRGCAEGLSVMVLNPSLVIGSGNWLEGSASIFAQVQEGLQFYPDGSTGIVDVRDVAQAVVQVLKHDLSGQRVIISAENQSYQDILSTIAENLHREKPKIKLNRVLIEVAVIRNWLLSKTSAQTKVITRASLKNAQHRWSFDHSKSTDLLQLTYRDIDECISETCKQFLEAMDDHLTPKFLPI